MLGILNSDLCNSVSAVYLSRILQDPQWHGKYWCFLFWELHRIAFLTPEGLSAFSESYILGQHHSET